MQKVKEKEQLISETTLLLSKKSDETSVSKELSEIKSRLDSLTS